MTIITKSKYKIKWGWVLFGVIFILIGLPELYAGINGNGRVTGVRNIDGPVANVDPWQRICSGAGLTILGLYFIVHNSIGIWSHKNK